MKGLGERWEGLDRERRRWYHVRSVCVCMSSSHGHSISPTGTGYKAAWIYNYSSIIRSKAKQISLSLQFRLSISCSLSLLVPTLLSCPLLFFNENTFFLKSIYRLFYAVCELSLVVPSGGSSLLWCTGFSLWWLLLLWRMGSRHTDFGSCGMRTQQLQLL